MVRPVSVPVCRPGEFLWFEQHSHVVAGMMLFALASLSASTQESAKPKFSVKIQDDFLTGRIRRDAREVLAQRLAGDGEAVAVQESCVEQHLH